MNRLPKWFVQVPEVLPQSPLRSSPPKLRAFDEDLWAEAHELEEEGETLLPPEWSHSFASLQESLNQLPSLFSALESVLLQFDDLVQQELLRLRPVLNTLAEQINLEMDLVERVDRFRSCDGSWRMRRIQKRERRALSEAKLKTRSLIKELINLYSEAPSNPLGRLLPYLHPTFGYNEQYFLSEEPLRLERPISQGKILATHVIALTTLPPERPRIPRSPKDIRHAFVKYYIAADTIPGVRDLHSKSEKFRKQIQRCHADICKMERSLNARKVTSRGFQGERITLPQARLRKLECVKKQLQDERDQERAKFRAIEEDLRVKLESDFQEHKKQTNEAHAKQVRALESNLKSLLCGSKAATSGPSPAP